MICDDRSLEFLLEADDGSDDFREIASHVESCSRCQSRLGELAADAADWQEACAWLREEATVDAPAGEEFAARKWIHCGGGQGVQAWSESMAKQVLSPPSHPEMLGRIGRYEVERLVGSGGMGVVFKALDTELNRAVAVKVLAPQLAGTGAARNRFAREARAAAAVVDEHVVAIHNVEVDGDSPFLVMQYVAGESLQSRIDRNGALNLCEVLRIAVQTARGLAAAHDQGLIHRDVKPSNIILENSVERALLTDFGLARAADEATITRSGYHPGTPHYMSPEQARGEAIDARSDLFSLGSVMYVMCTGRVPFRADTSYGIIRRIIDTEPRPVREINPSVPDWLCAIIAKLMSKEPSDRYGSALEVACLLEKCLAHVQEPTTCELPEVPLPEPRVQKSSTRPGKGVFLMLATFGIIALGAFAFVATEPPDISGNWSGEAWNKIELRPVEGKPHQYEGTFGTPNADTFGGDMSGDSIVPARSQAVSAEGTSRGTLQLKWSRLERRFNGTWNEDDRHFGRLSLQLEGDGVIRGARTTVKAPGDRSGTPRLADFKWEKRVVHNAVSAADQTPGEGELLAEAIHEFNLRQSRDEVGKTQPPLTIEEVVASIRAATLGGQPVNALTAARLFDAMQSVAKTGILPPEWRLRSQSLFVLENGVHVTAWCVRLEHGAEPTHFYHTIRLQPLDYQPRSNRRASETKQQLQRNRVPLGGLVQDARTQSSELSADQVIAGILYHLQRRDVETDEAARNELRRIVSTYSVRPDTMLTFGGNYASGDFEIWHANWRFEFSADDGRYAFFLNKHYLKSRKVERIPDSQISWGPPAADGLQFGVTLSREFPVRDFENALTPKFHFRNLTGKSTARFEYQIQNFEVEARKPTGQPLIIRRAGKGIFTSIPVFPVDVSGETRIDRLASPITVIAASRLDFEWRDDHEPLLAIGTEFPAEIHVRFRMHHPSNLELPKLLSGGMLVTVNEQGRIVTPALQEVAPSSDYRNSRLGSDAPAKSNSPPAGAGQVLSERSQEVPTTIGKILDEIGVVEVEQEALQRSSEPENGPARDNGQNSSVRFQSAQTTRTTPTRSDRTVLWFHSGQYVHFVLYHKGFLRTGLEYSEYGDTIHSPQLWKFKGKITGLSGERSVIDGENQWEHVRQFPINFDYEPPIQPSLWLDGRSYKLSDGRVFVLRREGPPIQLDVALPPVDAQDDEQALDRLEAEIESAAAKRSETGANVRSSIDVSNTTAGSDQAENTTVGEKSQPGGNTSTAAASKTATTESQSESPIQ